MYMCMVVNVLKGGQFVEKTAFHSVQEQRGFRKFRANSNKEGERGKLKRLV